MKSRTLTSITVMILFAALAIPVRLAAQDNQEHRQQHHHYKLIDLGTFGGLYNYISGDDLLAPYKGPAQNVNAAGALIGWADTSTPDPYAPLCFNADCLVSHAFQ